VPINKCGKLVVAKNKVEDGKLQRIYRRALTMGVQDLALIDGIDARKYFEPNLSYGIIGAIWSPHSCVIDTTAYCDALLHSGVTFSGNLKVVDIDLDGENFIVKFSDNFRLKCKELVNASGLNSHYISKLLGVRGIPRIEFMKGSYFACKGGEKPFERLVYPTRISGHLGIHYTVDTNGNYRFGPDSEHVGTSETIPCWDNNEEVMDGLFTVDPIKAMEFRNAVCDYWDHVPGIEHFSPEFSGIRPRIHGGHDDFMISQHGLKNFVSLYGIDSPGLTASLSIAHRVCDLLGVTGINAPEMKSQHMYEWE
jgi:L-2-hydroxyglutarate oxidase LhgO